jgi:hypothetical protein
MSLVTLSFMACQMVNGMLFCSEPVSSRIETTLPEAKIEMFESQKYMFVKDISMQTIADAIYADKGLPDKMNGCKFTTSNTGHKLHYFEFPCRELKKFIKLQ